MDRDMIDTMTATKVLGGLAGTLLVFLLGGWAAETIYAGGGHGEGELSYVIVEEGGEGGGEAVEEGPSFEEVYASADPAAGEGQFRACQACHVVEEGVNGTGPSLYGVVGRPAGAMDGFNYSGALTAVVDVWTPEHLNEFLAAPKSYTPGTSMGYNGMRKIEDRANLIAWLDSLDN